jgi:hypothetical protein
MEDRISREAKLNAAKEIVVAYIKSATVKEGENQKFDMNADQVCDLFKKVFETIEDVTPAPSRKVGLGL